MKHPFVPQLKTNNRQLTVSIGIPTYQSGGNIVNLLHSLRNQTANQFTILEIIVYSDGNSDDTARLVKNIPDNRIRLIEAKTRRGMARGVKTMLSLFRGDIFILLNDDIKLADNQIIEKLVQPFLIDRNIGLISGNPRPIPPRNFIERACFTSFSVYDRFRYLVNNGHNKFTCDGKCLALSRRFLNLLSLPKNDKYLGNVDIFFYLSCRALGFGYYHVKKAKVFYKHPSTLRDYVLWITRNNANRYLLKKRFGNLIREEFKVPKVAFLQSLITVFIVHPVECLFIFVIGKYCYLRAKSADKWFTPTWDVISSTKGSLSNI